MRWTQRDQWVEEAVTGTGTGGRGQSQGQGQGRWARIWRIGDGRWALGGWLVDTTPSLVTPYTPRCIASVRRIECPGT